MYVLAGRASCLSSILASRSGRPLSMRGQGQHWCQLDLHGPFRCQKSPKTRQGQVQLDSPTSFLSTCTSLPQGRPPSMLRHQDQIELISLPMLAFIFGSAAVKQASKENCKCLFPFLIGKNASRMYNPSFNRVYCVTVNLQASLIAPSSFESSLPSSQDAFSRDHCGLCPSS